MARIYSNENVAREIVVELRRLGHDVLTSFDSGRANAGVPDDQVVAFAFAEGRIVVTNNRRDFIRLHREGVDHAGVVVFTTAGDPVGIANRIAGSLEDDRANGRFLARIDGVGFRFDSD